MYKPLATAGLGLALLLTACGGSDDADAAEPIIIVDGATAAEDTTTTSAAASTDASTDTTTSEAPAESADQSDEELAFAFADCLRDEGLDVNDPTVNPDGTVNLQSLFGGGAPPAGADTEAALDTCGSMLDGANFGPAANGFDQTEIQDQLVEFAGCLRDQGLDVRDPDISGGIAAAAGGPEALFGLDIQDPQYEDQVSACSDILAFGPGAANS